MDYSVMRRCHTVYVTSGYLHNGVAWRGFILFVGVCLWRSCVQQTQLIDWMIYWPTTRATVPIAVCLPRDHRDRMNKSVITARIYNTSEAFCGSLQGTVPRGDTTIGLLIINVISMASSSIQQQRMHYNDRENNSDVQNWEPASTSRVWRFSTLKKVGPLCGHDK